MERVSRRDIIDAIGRYETWYQNIRFGFLLNTHSSLRKYVKRLLGELIPSKGMQAQLVLRSFPDVTGKRVIDVGCNSGLYSVEASCRGASHVWGIDGNSTAIEQAELVASLFRRLGRTVGDLEFRAGSINSNLEILKDRDIMFACCVLYHLGPLEDFVAAIRQSNIQMIVVQGNTARLLNDSEKNIPGVPGYEPEHKTWGNVLSDVAGISKFVGRCGFTVSTVYFRHSQFPVVNAVRGNW